MSADRFEHDGAAYVMGSLSPSERAGFEAHLAACPDCGRRVADLREVLAALALAPESAYDVGVSAAGPVPELLLPRLLEQVRRRRRRQRAVAASSLLVAAAAVAALLVTVFTPDTPDATKPTVQASAMANVLDVPIMAKADVVRFDSGSRVDLWCTYEAGDDSDGDYVLRALLKDGREVQLGTWPGIPGRTAVMHISTALQRSDIVCIEIVGWTGKVVSRLTL